MVKVKGHSDHTTKDGHLYLKNKAKYIKTPYRLLRSEEFLSLEPIAMKLYWLIISRWKVLEPDEPVDITYDSMRMHCLKLRPDGEGGSKKIYPSNSTITKAISDLNRLGFVYKDTRHKKSNRYWVEQKWFTGEFQ